MVKIKVRFMAQIATAAGASEHSMEVMAADDLHAVLRRLPEGNGGALMGVLFDASGTLRPSVLVFADEQMVPRGSAVSWRDGMTLTLTSPMAGG